MKKLAAVALMGAFLIAPATVDAKRASSRVAKAAAVEAAYLVYLEVPEVVDYGRGDCKRTSAHRLWCWSWVDIDEDENGYNEATCWWKTITYRRHRSGRYVFRMGATVDCDENDNGDEFEEEEDLGLEEDLGFKLGVVGKRLNK